MFASDLKEETQVKDLFKKAVQQMGDAEKTELIGMGGSLEAGAVAALKQGVNQQLDKLLPEVNHMRIVKP